MIQCERQGLKMRLIILMSWKIRIKRDTNNRLKGK